MVTRIKQRRAHEAPDLLAPIFVWEPVPDMCVPGELFNCYKALRNVDYVSPNHMELSSFYSRSGNIGDEIDREFVEQCAREFVDSGVGENGLGPVIVRCGKWGCCIVSNKSQPVWLPPYHQDSSKVIDPTGAGNCFLGGFAVSIARGVGIEEAALAGSVAASFAVEQLGMPKLSIDEEERWNGDTVRNRLLCHPKRLK